MTIELVDRTIETKRFDDLLKDGDAHVFLVYGEHGKGKRFFVNEYLQKKDINKLFISPIRGESILTAFVRSLAETDNTFLEKITDNWTRRKLVDDADIKKEFTDCSQTTREKIFSFFSNPQNTTKYRIHSRKGTTTYEDSSDSILATYLDDCSIDYFVFKFGELTETAKIEIKALISRFRNKKFILIFDADDFPSEFYEYRYFGIKVGHFRKDDFLNLFHCYRLFSSNELTEEISEKLFYQLDGSPSRLHQFLEPLYELDDMTSDKAKQDKILTELHKQQDHSSLFINAKGIVLVSTYLSKGQLEDCDYAQVLKCFDFSKEDYNNTIDFLVKSGYLNSNLMLTPKGHAAMAKAISNNASAINKIAFSICEKCGAQITDSFLFSNRFAYFLARAAIFLKNTYSNEKHLDNNYMKFDDIIMKVADCTQKTNRKLSASFYSSLFTQNMIYLGLCKKTYAQKLNIATQLYENGYYEQTLRLLETMSCKKTYKYYLLKGKTSMLFDNNLSIQSFTKAADLANSVDQKLEAIRNKLMAMNEINDVVHKDTIAKEYAFVLSEFNLHTDNEQYISLQRNALDFQSNGDAIETMESALRIAESKGFLVEVAKLRQNIALNYIRLGNYPEAEKLLKQVYEFYKPMLSANIAYPCINLCVIEIFNYFFEKDSLKKNVCLNKAWKYIIEAIDYASSYYSKTLSQMHMIMLMSISHVEYNKYNADDLQSIRCEWAKKCSERNDARVHRRVQFTLTYCIATILKKQGLSNEDRSKLICEAKGYLNSLSMMDLSNIDALKLDALNYAFDNNDFSSKRIDAQSEYDATLEFQPWLISLTHDD